ncbi:transmembrane protein [Thalictrum thalictroides]|uniref:Transmembrane protein n=1 Tax=Thalictrum thalictroides TaxID=46969 RepID=A0A7J6VAZ8_THATH|nr:transmembrane protein [Thalictrum thalictroides]
MEANIFPHHLCSLKPPTPFLVRNQHSPFTTQISLKPVLFRFHPLKATEPTINNSSINSSGDDGNNLPSNPQSVKPPPDTVEIRFKRGSRRRSKEKEMDTSGGKPAKRPSPPKDWESMTIGEKAVELYVGEKGALYWLNKFAYASIYIVIGGWILFRFVGPSLGLYQLDTPPLSPTNILK